MNLQFRKKPVVIEAFQMTLETRQDNRDWPAWLHEAWNKDHAEAGAVFPSKHPDSDGTDELMIHTLEGDHLVSFDDWIIRGVKGELYPCKPDIFEATYEAAAVLCNTCGKDTSQHYLMCDEQEGAWCPRCFEATACGRGEHGEGCPTAVFEEDPKEPALAPAGEISSRPPPAPLEDIGEVDAVSFAARVAQTAAAEFCGLMAYGEPVPIVPWYDPAHTPRDLERATADIMALAGYVTARDVDQGERLWRWAIEKRIVAGSPDGFGLLPFAVAGAYVLFVENCRRTVRHIELEQKRAADRKAAAARTEPPKLKLEDTIYEPVEPMSAMRPEAVAAIPLIASYEAGQAEERRAAALQRQLEESETERARLAAEVAKMDPDGDGRIGGSKPGPQSIGEAPARPPAGNRGGRPKKAK